MKKKAKKKKLKVDSSVNDSKDYNIKTPNRVIREVREEDTEQFEEDHEKQRRQRQGQVEQRAVSKSPMQKSGKLNQSIQSNQSKTGKERDYWANQESKDSIDSKGSKTGKTVAFSSGVKPPQGGPTNYESQRNQIMSNYKTHLIQIEDNVFDTNTSSKIPAAVNKMNKFGGDTSISKEDSRLESGRGRMKSSKYGIDDDIPSVDFRDKAGNNKAYTDAAKNRSGKSPNRLGPSMFDDPGRVDQYVKSQAGERNVDMSFVDRNLLYQKKTMNESMAQLKKKNEELDDIVGELNFKDNLRVSRPSMRNTVEIKEYSTEDEPGFFDKLKNIFTCINREKPTPASSNNGRTKKK